MSHLDHTGSPCASDSSAFCQSWYLFLTSVLFQIRQRFNINTVFWLELAVPWEWAVCSAVTLPVQSVMSSVFRGHRARLLTPSFLPLKIYGILTNYTFHSCAIDCLPGSFGSFLVHLRCHNSYFSFIQSGVYFPARFLFVFELRFMIGFDISSYWVLSQNIRLLFS